MGPSEAAFTFTYDGIDLVISLIAIVLSAIAVGSVILHRWRTDNREDNKDEIERREAINKRFEEIGRDLENVKGHFGDIPGVRELHQLELSASGLSGDIKSMDKRIDGLGREIGEIRSDMGRIPEIAAAVSSANAEIGGLKRSMDILIQHHVKEHDK